MTLQKLANQACWNNDGLRRVQICRDRIRRRIVNGRKAAESRRKTIGSARVPRISKREAIANMR